ncbi:MAG: twin-arginine translocase subunit TatC [Actinomycetota bacterium]|nr:twin-arginine translocase subunit TatC [Actinomycetota bacterium]
MPATKVQRFKEMSLIEHLRELRSRLFKASVAIVIGTVAAWGFYPQIFDILSQPVNEIVEKAQANGRDVRLVLGGVADAFILQIKVSVVTSLLITCPIWIYQLWRFITPGLYRKEKLRAYLFAAVATPLFVGGAVLAYLLLPLGLSILFGFTPLGVGNYVPVDRYLSFFLRMVLVFGISFLTPLFIVMLNIFDMLEAKAITSRWRVVVLGVFAFAAVATPTGDPVNMTLLAAPVLLLISIATFIAWLNDKRRARKRQDDPVLGLSDDEASPEPKPATDL